MVASRSIGILIAMAALLAACAGQPKTKPQPKNEPVVAYLPPSQNALQKPQLPAPPPPPRFKSETLIGQSPERVEFLLGKTDLVREEGQMILWRYKGIAESEADKTKACPLLIFFEPLSTGGMRVIHVDSPAGSPDTCADALRLKQRKS